MLNENEGLKDWEEAEEENPPENLRRKWIEREYFGKKSVLCEACRHEVPAENITCLFCGAQINHDTGLLGKLLKGIKNLFR